MQTPVSGEPGCENQHKEVALLLCKVIREKCVPRRQDLLNCWPSTCRTRKRFSAEPPALQAAGGGRTWTDVASREPSACPLPSVELCTRKPPLGSESSALRMESGGGSPGPPAPIIALGMPDAGPGCCSVELPSTDQGKLQALPIGLGAHSGNPVPGSAGSQATAGDSPLDTGPTGGPSRGTKIPNWDSRIGSPSYSVAEGHIPREEGREVGSGHAVQGLLLARAPDDKALREEADSDVGEDSSEEPNPEDSPLRADVDPAKCSGPQKLLHIAQELLRTEETYVRRLHLLDQVFCARLTAAGIPPEVTTGIFSNISSIYRFHGQFLLPELRTRITEEWDTKPRLGDILQKLAPFLKMYGEYVKNFDRAVELVSSWTQRSLLFKDIVHGIQEKMHKLLEVYERLGGEENIVNPANELIKEGHIQKLSAKSGAAQDRHLFLFNSMILYCVPKLRLMGQKFSVREKMDISDLQVQDVVKPNSAPTFILVGRKRSLELQTRTEEEKKEWIQVIQATMEQHKQNSQSFKAFSSSFGQDEATLTPEPPMVGPGFEEPVGAHGRGAAAATGMLTAAVHLLQPEPWRGSSKSRWDKEKQGCWSCGETFNSITKRKHRCKLCGVIICGKCSEFKAENGRQSRVCRGCFLMQPVAPTSLSLEVLPVSEHSTEDGQPLQALPLSSCTVSVDPAEGLHTGVCGGCAQPCRPCT
ncbi:FYVE, RhoGEF and PH domain-containing protein 3 isoform X5 [Manis javanica]|uniref:FYVE, RhoGEF and PH domain-containing protein 3 isoform X5 n=1 Tax=Manis javanica TaxID=9974 RepID=UPI003C6D25D9